MTIGWQGQYRSDTDWLVFTLVHILMYSWKTFCSRLQKSPTSSFPALTSRQPLGSRREQRMDVTTLWSRGISSCLAVQTRTLLFQVLSRVDWTHERCLPIVISAARDPCSPPPPTTSPRPESKDGDGGADRGICRKRSSSVAAATCHSDISDDASEAWKAHSRTQDRPSGLTVRTPLYF